MIYSEYLELEYDMVVCLGLNFNEHDIFGLKNRIEFCHNLHINFD